MHHRRHRARSPPVSSTAPTGQPFGPRGKRLDEMIPALRSLWSGDWTAWDGQHVRFPKLKISPVPGRPAPI